MVKLNSVVRVREEVKDSMRKQVHVNVHTTLNLTLHTTLHTQHNINLATTVKNIIKTFNITLIYTNINAIIL